MATQQKEEGNQTASAPATEGLRGMIEERYRKIKENAEAYPYVWASYIFVYGTLALWTTYRWRKLRKTEDRVRVLHERLRKLYEAEESAAGSTASTDKMPLSTNKTPAASSTEKIPATANKTPTAAFADKTPSSADKSPK